MDKPSSQDLRQSGAPRDDRRGHDFRVPLRVRAQQMVTAKGTTLLAALKNAAWLRRWRSMAGPFEADVPQILIPEHQPADIAIRDKSSSHERVSVRERMKPVDATCASFPP
jgi:hypothetical protein